MKNLSVIIVLFFFCLNSFPQETESKYVFPIRPGDYVWKEIRYPERLDRLRLPDSILQSLSNTQLIGACMEYPYSINLFAFDNLEEAFQNLKMIFNGYQELFKRQNIANDLMLFYTKMQAFSFLDNYSHYNELQNPLNFYLIEQILSHYTGYTLYTN